MKKICFLLIATLSLMGNLSISAADVEEGLIRLRNRRSATAYLTTNANGSAIGATKTPGGLSQVWILEKSGNGYTVRSANSGEYLQANFPEPSGAKTTLYIQVSPNNGAYYNISSSSDFSGQTCLNLNGDGKTIYKWSYSGDAGSDWTIERATDVTEDQVRDNLTKKTGYVGELKDGAYYRIVNTYYTRMLTEGSDLVANPLDETNLAQYWQIHKSGAGYTIQSVVYEKYIQHQTSTSVPYHMGNSAVAFNIKPVSDKWLYKWTIAYGSEGSGLHAAATQEYNVVYWSTNADASVWAFQEVELSIEDIEKARATQKAYQDLITNRSKLQTCLNNLFEDKACTTLKAEIQALGDEQLAENTDFAALNEDMKAMVLKVKNNTWKQYTNTSTNYTAGYEKFFRIADYKAYSNYESMANGSNFTMSNSFGKLSGPTGIVANQGDIIYVYVDANPKTGSTLMLEAVTTAGVPGDHRSGETTALKAGLNVFMFSEQKMLYIFHQVTDPKRLLSLFPDIKIHIEGGQLNGYWDATRGMTNADWKLLQKELLKASPVLNLKTNHLVFAMDAELVKKSEPNEMEGLMRVWDKIPENEESYMGVEDFEGRYRNIWNCFSIDYNYMFASTNGTYYNNSTLPTIMNYYNMTHMGEGNEGGAIWGPSHEMGHNHQASINVIGTTESSNNLFSNINVFEQGLSTTRYKSPVGNFDYLAENTPWLGRKIEVSTRMFFQLYLYFHAMHNDDNFLPNLFRAMRKNPINKGTWDGSATFKNSDGTTGTGAYIANGAQDYLKLATTICDVAQADLSEFFESYGMFVPVSSYHVGDYSNYLVTTNETAIRAAKLKMQKYPKKLGNIMFIDDHIVSKPSNANNKFEGVPTSTKKVNCCTYTGSKIGTAGDVGDYEVFDGHEENDVTDDYFTLSGSKITFKGSGYIGHKFYDLDGNLIWATNAKSTTLPQSLRDLGVDNFRVVAAQENMTDVPCPYAHTSSPIYGADVYFGDAENNKVWYANANTELDKYMQENSIAVMKSENAPESITKTPNVISKDNTASIMNINGDLPFYMPVETTAERVTFQKTVSGYAALDLPFSVTNSDMSDLKTATYDNNELKVVDAESVTAGMPVVVSQNVDLTLNNAKVIKGNYQALANVLILNSAGNSVEKAESASPFTFPMERATGIKSVKISPEADGSLEIYDLTGRRLLSINRPGLYIVNGKKVLIK